MQELFDDISNAQKAALKEKLDDQSTQAIFPSPGCGRRWPLRPGFWCTRSDVVHEHIRFCRFVVKTVEESGKKVFINLCSSDAISPPTSWENGIMPDSVRQALHNLDDVKSEEDVQAMRVPLSLSDQRSETDKNGNTCAVFDCVFAEQVMAEAARFRPMKVFVIECCLGWIQHKCHIQLDPKFKLPKLKYKGDVIHEHRIRKEPKKLVTEVEEVAGDDQPSLPLLTKKPAKSMGNMVIKAGTGSTGIKRHFEPAQSTLSNPVPSLERLDAPGLPPLSSTAVAMCQSHDSSLEQAFVGGLKHPHPPAHLVDVEYQERPCQSVCITLHMKSHTSVDAPETLVKVDLNCVVVCQGEGSSLAVPLNVFVIPSTCKCNLQGDTLKVVLDYMPVDDVIACAKDQRPLEFGAVDLKSHATLHELD